MNLLKVRGDQIAKELVYCQQCGAELWKYSSEIQRNKSGFFFCSKKCKKEYLRNNNVQVECSYCGKPYYAKLTTACRTVHCCSDKCKELYRIEHTKLGEVELECEYCGSYFTIPMCHANRNKHHYCSQECAHLGRRKRITKICPECGKTFECHSCDEDKRVYCSLECRDNARRKEVGPLNKNYSRVWTNCNYCGKELLMHPYRLKRHVFCCVECFQAWIREYAKTEEYREKSRRRSPLTYGTQVTTNTKPHLAVQGMLNALGVRYQTEYVIDYYSADIYIPSIHAIVEVNGDFWHIHPVKYTEVKYINSYLNIIKDIRRHHYIVEERGIPILYLWENDINNDPELCLELLMRYIAQEGVLDEYHSLNYSYSKDGGLLVNDTRVTPYNEYNLDNLPLSDRLREELQVKSA